VQLAIQFAVANPAIATTLVGTANPVHLERNVAYAETPADPRLLEEVLEILRPIKNHNFTRGRPENRDPILA
jgi:L-galactose dehydrogenase